MSDNLKPHMSDAEINLLGKYIPNEARILEFGCGGSTLFFLEKGASYLFSVESDLSWLQHLLSNPAIRIYYKFGRWVPCHAHIGPTAEWGKPLAQTPELQWLNYHMGCWSNIPQENFDYVLIDGRFRVACLCQYLLRNHNPSVNIAIHDFWNRPQYHCLLSFLDVVEQVDTLGIFQPKENIDFQKVGLLLQEYLFIIE